nr:MAG TPA: hypothetical protein [Caudoviricetes sp.]
MKALKFVAPTYEILEERKTLCIKNVIEGTRLEIRAFPLNPSDGYVPDSLQEAYESVILVETDLKETDQCARVIWEIVNGGMNLEIIRAAGLKAAMDGILSRMPDLEDDERTAYICPIISHGGVGYERGYVVAWEESDALDVAEYLAGGRVEILCGLVDTKEQQAIDSVWLGELSYSDVTCDTDQYRRIIEGENTMLALETLEGIEPPACEDPEYPGAESLATFTKME